MVDNSKPRSDVSDVRRGREIPDSLNEPVAGTHRIQCTIKPGKFNRILDKGEFGWVEDDAMLSADVKPSSSLEETLLD